ncbi:ACT domain-containing protein [Cesiribacter sp. SM1]|uniref:ACT domain-containing protein n=1 Tax=Cesiribacter sp. SM1 TaxID=2861196 RepID=UPI001CD1FCDB|nr:ACT domain-containing protein [Cesiribacter sp. SM1]
MAGETDIHKLVRGMTPVLNPGEYIFTTTQDENIIKRADTIGTFREQEGTTLIMERTKADALALPYEYIAAWISLMVHSSLEAVGLTALFSAALAKHNISCNVVAGYYHDHIFVDKKDEARAMEVLSKLSETQQ